MLDQQLQELGLSPNEASVYLALLKVGETTIGNLQHETDLHRQIIYNTCQALKNKNLIFIKTKRNKKFFSANDPELILNDIEEQKTLIKNILPQLYSLRGTAQQKSLIQVYDSVNGIQKFHEQQIKQSPPGSCVYAIGAGGKKFYDLMMQKYFFIKYENMRIDKKISHELLFYERQRKDLLTEFKIRKYAKNKFLPNHFNQPLSTQIWPDRISILIFEPQPQLIEIKNIELVKSFKNYFDLLWQIAKK